VIKAHPSALQEERLGLKGNGLTQKEEAGLGCGQNRSLRGPLLRCETERPLATARCARGGGGNRPCVRTGGLTRPSTAAGESRRRHKGACGWSTTAVYWTEAGKGSTRRRAASKVAGSREASTSARMLSFTCSRAEPDGTMGTRRWHAENTLGGEAGGPARSGRQEEAADSGYSRQQQQSLETDISERGRGWCGGGIREGREWYLVRGIEIPGVEAGLVRPQDEVPLARILLWTHKHKVASTRPTSPRSLDGEQAPG
jgi:hypothetical protein